MPRRALVVLVVVFAVTRGASAWLAAHPDVLAERDMTPSTDVAHYETAARSIIEDGSTAYVDSDFEYPPGTLPFIVLPDVLRAGHSFLVAFVLLMVLVDAAGFVALLLMAKRSGNLLGAWVWVLGVAALGPLVQLRLDLIPAVATIWAMQRTSVGAWTGAGAFLGIGIMAKLYPALLVPHTFILSRGRARFVIALAVAGAAFLVPFVADIPEVVHDVLGYHLQRGLQIESLGGSVIFLAGLFGYNGSEIVFNFGALHFSGGISDSIKSLSSAAALVAVGSCIWLATKARTARREVSVEIAFVAITLSVALGSVFSPQFMVWILALGAAVACFPDSKLGGISALLVALSVLTFILTLPFIYLGLIAGSNGPVLYLLTRNLVLLGIGVWSFVKIYRRVMTERAEQGSEPASGPSTPDLVSG